MVDFVFVLRVVIALTIVSGVLAIAVAVASAIIPVPMAGQLLGTFLDTFRIGTAAILALIGGRGGQSRGR